MIIKKVTKKRSITKTVDSRWARRKFPLWLQLLALIILAIGFAIDYQVIDYALKKQLILSLVCLCLYFFVFNMAYRSINYWTKHVLMYNVLTIMISLIWTILVLLSYKGTMISKIIMVIFVCCHVICLSIATYFAYRIYCIISFYICYRETEFNLKNFAINVNGKPSNVKISLAPGHLVITIDRQRYKYSVDKLSNLYFQCISLTKLQGQIRFTIDKFNIEFSFKKIFEDILFYALAYNILRVNPHAWQKSKLLDA